MLLPSEREMLVECCRRLARSHLGSGTSGNVSVFDRDSRLVAISPSAMDYEQMTAADVVIVDLEGQPQERDGRRASSELEMHLGCYRQRDDVNAVVHTHSPQATTLAVLGRELPAVHYMIALSGRGTVPCAPYHLFGTAELADAAVSALDGGYGVLLQSHGVLACGTDLNHAWSLAEQIEFCAGLYLQALAVGKPTILSTEQIEAVSRQFSLYTRQD